MKNRMSQRVSTQQSFGFGAKIANLLEMPGVEYAQLIQEIEKDPIFVKLRYAENVSERAVRMRRLQQTNLSQRFFELKENLVSQDTDSFGEVEKLIEGKKEIIDTVRKIGEDNFKRYFIFNEEDFSLDDIAKHCHIGQEEAKQVFSLINSVDVYGEFFTPAKSILEQTVSYNKIAVLVPGPAGYTVQFLSAHWARGVYDIDYEKIKRLVENGKYTKTEQKNIRKLLEKMELVNIKKSLMANVIAKVIEKQKMYLQSLGETSPQPFKQAELAKAMGVHPSIVSRAISGRSIELPWGIEKPLKEFFVSGKIQQKERALYCIQEILNNEKKEIENNRIRKPFSDKTISLILQKNYAIIVAPRTVAKYRNQMQVISAFQRHKP